MSFIKITPTYPVAPGNKNCNYMKQNHINLACRSGYSRINNKRHLPSPPFIKRKLKASFTIEATVVLPIFLTLIMLIGFFFKIIQVQSGVQQALDMSSRTFASTWNDEKDDEGQLTAAEIYALACIKKNDVPLEFISGGLLGINLSESSCAGNYLDLKAVYYMKFPIGLLGQHNYRITQESRNRKWVGYDPAESAWDGNYVYIAKNGEVYHKDVNCSYLNINLLSAAAGSIALKRNKSGHKYYSCKSCKGDANAGIVYYTEYGEVYHSKVNCTSIRKSIQRVLYDSVKDSYPPCSKCGQ